jgi:1-acyl-sn-glycerol-3-phosphate acyltransferase
LRRASSISSRICGAISRPIAAPTRARPCAALAALGEGKTLALFPEGGAWADVLRPGRPGAAWLALQSQAPVVPIGIDGTTQVFRKWRPTVIVRIGKPLGPFQPRSGATPRQAQQEATEEIMRAIAVLIPPERRGVWSDDPAIRAAAGAAAQNPFEQDEFRGL